MNHICRSQRFYIAGMGMITPVGGNVAMTSAAVNAGISAYQSSEYENQAGDAITLARVPDSLFKTIQCRSQSGSVSSYRLERMIRLVTGALREAVAGCETNQAVPLVLALPELEVGNDSPSLISPRLAQNVAPWISPQLTRPIASGRAAGMEVLAFAFKYLLDPLRDYLLVGGVDSFDDAAVLARYEDRLLSVKTADAFAAGEGAGALLLTPQLKLAQACNGFAIALHMPGIAEEEGHLFSQEPFRGEGLDKAFKRALQYQPAQAIDRIYSSMNGEHHWAKEYGVAYMRNKNMFCENVQVEHPADCFGDLGAATGLNLVILAAEHLRKNKNASKYLVYSSSDTALRGATVIEKIPVAAQV